ncbi:hypothetical protein [Nonomuraea sp. NPDC049607]|uniref:hypothetical protein n=1 Tax=Nonomuraea sp. NPDC049607 TaxID=3154732 RepID=UPI0034120FA6
MILISAGLVLAAVVLLIAGFVLAKPFLIMWSIVVSVLSALFLVIGALLRRHELFPGGGRAAAPATPPAPLPPPGLPYNQTGPAGPQPRPQPHPHPQTPQRTAVPASAPRRPAASGISPDAIVLVIPGRRRYHVPGCRQLAGRDHEELTHEEAREEGFTPCTTCLPDAALGGRQLPPAADPEPVVTPGPGATPSKVADNRAEASAETRDLRPPVAPPKPDAKASTPTPEPAASREEGTTGWFGRPAAAAQAGDQAKPSSPSSAVAPDADDEQGDIQTSYFRPPSERERPTRSSSSEDDAKGASAAAQSAPASSKSPSAPAKSPSTPAKEASGPAKGSSGSASAEGEGAVPASKGAAPASKGAAPASKGAAAASVERPASAGKPGAGAASSGGTGADAATSGKSVESAPGKPSTAARPSPTDQPARPADSPARPAGSSARPADGPARPADSPVRPAKPAEPAARPADEDDSSDPDTAPQPRVTASGLPVQPEPSGGAAEASERPSGAAPASSGGPAAPKAEGAKAPTAPAKGGSAGAGKKGEAPEGGSGDGPARAGERSATVKVIVGTRRYHGTACPLIRGAGDTGVETMTVAEAEAAGLTSCSVCRNDRETTD